MPFTLASPPEQGQLVSVRSRNWIVNEVVPSTLPATGVQGISDPQTLVSLASVEDDGLGEEIQVVWELASISTVTGGTNTLGIDRRQLHFPLTTITLPAFTGVRSPLSAPYQAE